MAATMMIQEAPAATTAAAMYTVPEVATLLGYSAWTIRQWAHQGALPGARKMGGQWRFNREKMDAYIARAGGRGK